MKKLNLFLCAFMMAAMAFAQRTNLVMCTPNLGSEYSVNALSPNGQWACGAIFDGVERGFLWNLNTGEIIELSLQGTSSTAKGVSDDGVVCGSFETTDGTPNNRPVLTYGTWKQGVWTTLEIENEDNGAEISRGGIATTISRDGHHVAGIAHSGNCYKPIVWENGVLSIVDDIEGAVYDMSDNGTLLCGWTTHPEKKNRTSCIWNKQDDGSFSKYCIDLDSPYAAGPFSVATGISPNNKYIIACNTIYNVETGDTVRHEIDFFRSGFELVGVTNDGSAYGFADNGEFPGGAEKVAIKITLDGKMTNVRDYLIGRGVNLDAYPYVQNVISISEDEKTYVLAAYDEYYVPCNLVVKLGADLHMAPVSLTARKLEGLNGMTITWKAPLYTSETPKGYNFYRNGEKLNSDLLTSMQYTDVNLSAGEYTYNVTAVYNDNTESEKSQELPVTVKDNENNAPIMLRAFASGLNDARLIWEHPYSNLPAIRYVNDNDIVFGLGADQLSFECGIAARASELKLYKDAGYKITEISFIPKSRQNSWTLNFYKKGSYDKPIYTEEIPSDNLIYGMVNYHTLKTPLEIPEGQDLVMAIYVDATNYGGYDIIGMNTKKADPGYSDLIRQEDEKEMYSLYEQAMNSEYGAMEYNVCWSMGMHFAKGNDNNNVKQYIISSNGSEVGTSAENNFRITNLANGKYEFGVVAEYANGAKSEPTMVSMDVKANKSVCKTVVPTVTAGDGEATLTWEAPAVKDQSIITYANDFPNGGVLPRKDQDYSYILGSVYKGNELVPYENYEINAFRFYPLSDAQFTFHLFENNVEIASKSLVKGEGYIRDQWNTAMFDAPVMINRNNTYMLTVECNNCTPDEYPIGMDNQIGYPMLSDLYSVNGGYSYGSIYQDGGKDGNWMIGLEVSSVNKFDLSVEGYNIYLNDELHNQDMVTENSYVINNLETGKYGVCVNPVYPNGIGEKSSKEVTFEITVSGIEDITASTFEIERNAEFIHVNGGNVTAIEMYDINGSKVAMSDNSTISIASLNNGVYVLSIKIDGKTVNTKVSVRR